MENRNTVAPINNLLTPKATADILGVSEGTLTVWRSVGRYDLKSTKIGRKVMYKPESVQEFIENRTQTQTVSGC